MTPGTPPTPPDKSRDTRSDDPDAPPGSKPPRSVRPAPGAPHSPTSDEFSVLLSSSMALPEPDPMLGGSSSWDLPAASEPAPAPGAARRSRSAVGLDIVVEPVGSLTTRGVSGGPPVDEERPYAWSHVLLKSYASALTLALVWFLWTGKAAPKPAPAAPSREAPAARRRPLEPTPPPASSSTVSTTATDDAGAAELPAVLGKPFVVGDLEITPLLVLRKSVRTTRSLGEETLVRDHGGCLALTLRLKNLAAEEAIRPLDAEDLRDGEAFTIDAPPGPRIAMFAMAPRSEWVLDQPSFPTLEPGAVEDVVLVSEPVSRGRLAPAMTWRLRVRAGGGGPESADVAVRFSRNDVHGDD